MFQKFLAIFGLILLFFGVWTPLLFIPVLFLGDPGLLLVCDLGISIVMVVIFIPYFNFISKVVFHFRGMGDLKNINEIKQNILDINNYDAPIMIREEKGQIFITWKYVDAKWWELIAKTGLQKIYEVQVKFDEKTHTATLIDRFRTVKWKFGINGVSGSLEFFRGIAVGYEFGKAYGLKENFTLGKIYDFKFRPSDIKTPVTNTILAYGWDVRFGIW
ncbi:hypothetical protein A2335_04930 [Candidatus Peregrinibacteria bacterium RIFOXYB2_FULL_32_7]|nr:MAG: hypothetical protein A2335_04930 [Candidatus Peregrinibacteria bacterium RIFOXYB2_FULL_32_7]